MEICQKDALNVVGIQVNASWGDLWQEVPKAWQELFKRQDEIKHRQHNFFLDVSLQEKDGEYIQLVGAEVHAIEDVPDGMTAVEIPNQKYLTYRHTGPVSGIAESFGQMYAWAEAHDIPVDEFKLDIGYMPEGLEPEHRLFIRVVA